VAYKVLFSDDSLIAFDDILSFIQQDNAAAAEEFGKALLNHVALLSNFPRIGEAVRGRPGFRKLLHSPVLIYYRIHEDRKMVEVIQIRHGSRRQLKFT
jgi:plasmid stabilization system protein ParE